MITTRPKGHSFFVMGVTLILAAACTNDKAPAAEDSALLHDLAMAEGAGPALEDTAVGTASSPTPPATKAKATTPRTTPATQPVVERPAATPAAPARKIAMGAGTTIGLTTGSRVCTTNRPGDKFIATLSSEVIGNDGFRFPAGSKAVVEVLTVNHTENGESASIDFRIRAISVDGVTYPVTGDVTTVSALEKTSQSTSSNDKKKVIGGAIAGAVLGQVLGKDTKSTVIGAAAGAAAGTVAARAGTKYAGCLPAQSALRLTLTEPIYAT
jgi:hypothetical protein